MPSLLFTLTTLLLPFTIRETTPPCLSFTNIIKQEKPVFFGWSLLSTAQNNQDFTSPFTAMRNDKFFFPFAIDYIFFCLLFRDFKRLPSYSLYRKMTWFWLSFTIRFDASLVTMPTLMRLVPLPSRIFHPDWKGRRIKNILNQNNLSSRVADHLRLVGMGRQPPPSAIFEWLTTLKLIKRWLTAFKRIKKRWLD
jgi:hypothetical protein